MAAALLWFGLVVRPNESGAESAATFIEYRAQDGCPTQAEFIEQVLARTPRAHFASERKHARVLAVSVGLLDGEAMGSLSAERGGERGSRREVTGKTCGDVVSALALVAALAIDPDASTGPVLPVPAATGAAAPPPAGATSMTRDQLPERTDASRASGRIGTIGGGVRGAASTWPISEPAYFATVWGFLEYDTNVRAVVSPAWRLSAGRGESWSVRPSAGAARFTRTTVALDVCPLRLDLASHLSLRPCAGVEGGKLDATGASDGPINHPGEVSLGWVALRESARLRGDLGKGWSVELEAGIAEPLQRDTFVFTTPAVTITRIPPIEPVLGMAVGAHFW